MTCHGQLPFLLQNIPNSNRLRESRRDSGPHVGTEGAPSPELDSLTNSSAEDAPRGMGFLYNPHRLNVATSRARCACILVATEQLFEPDCRTSDQMRWANGVCRYRDLARVVRELHA